MTRSVLVMMLLVSASACSERGRKDPASTPSPRSQNSGLGTVRSIKPVHVASGFTVWRDGERLTVHDGLLLRVNVANSFEFMPQAAMTPPLFVLGDTVALSLSGPFSSGEAILLTGSPAPEADVPLWLTLPGETPEGLKGTRLVQQQSQALAANAALGLTLHTPPASEPRTSYATMRDLSHVELLYRASKELCREVGKECGIALDTRLGNLDCGPCDGGG